MLEQLQKFDRWLCWRMLPQEDGGLKKIPVSPVTCGLASCSDPASWSSYQTALDMQKALECQSIGFALGKEIGLTTTDLDKLVEKAGDPWPQWALDIIEELDSYTEISASGRGFHILAWGTIPANFNRQKKHIEMHDCDRMFAFTGNVFQGRSEIHNRQTQLVALYDRVTAERVIPRLIAERDSPKFKEIVAGEWAKHGMGRSEAVQSALVTLAQKYNCDAEKMRAAFEITPLCADWEQDGKWSRLGEKEIETAIAFAKTLEAEKRKPLEFKKPAVQGGDYDFVLAPKEGGSDGWFPLGEVSLLAAPSGGGKTTLAADILDRQARGEDVFGHKTFGRSYMFLLEDRTDAALRRTLNRMHLPELPYRKLDLDGKTLPQAINDMLESEPVIPQVLFIEGIDLATPNGNKMDEVNRMLKDLVAVAAHYHVAIIGSTGCPKKDAKSQYVALRDNIFGSVAWARKVETVIVLAREHGKETDEITKMFVLSRNDAAEVFRLRFEHGRLVEAPPEPVVETPAFTIVTLLAWASAQEEPWTYADVMNAFGVSRDCATKYVNQAHSQGLLLFRSSGQKKLWSVRREETI